MIIIKSQEHIMSTHTIGIGLSVIAVVCAPIVFLFALIMSH